MMHDHAQAVGARAGGGKAAVSSDGPFLLLFLAHKVMGVTGLLEFSKSRRGGELIGIVVLAIGISLGASIVSYHPNDSSAFFTSTNQGISNAIGYYGATIAWLFVGFFGLASLLFPSVLLFIGWSRFWGREIEYVQTKLIGLAVLVLALPPLFDLGFGKRWFRGALIPTGGYLGQEINRSASANLNASGAAILLVTALLVGLLLSTRISLAAMFLGLRQWVVGIGRTISMQWARFTERRRRERMKQTILRKHLERVEQDEPMAARGEIIPARSAAQMAATDAEIEEQRGPVVREVRGRGRFQIRKVTKAELRKAAEALANADTHDPSELYTKANSSTYDPLDPANVERTPISPRAARSRALAREIDVAPSSMPRSGERSARAALRNLTEMPQRSAVAPAEESRATRAAMSEGSPRPRVVRSDTSDAPEESPVAIGAKPAFAPTALPKRAEKLVPQNSDADEEPIFATAGSDDLAARRSEMPRPMPRRTPQQERAAASQGHARLETNPGGEALPSVDYLTPGPKQDQISDEIHKKYLEVGHLIEERCREFSVDGEVTAYHPGPVVTTFEFKPSAGVKYAKVVNLGDDLALSLKAESIRIERISGSSTVGIEVPNRKRELIRLRDIIDTDNFNQSSSLLSLALGKDIHGEPVITDLAKMPHLLVAGATGAGKSVGLNSMIVSLLYKALPRQLRLLMIDPKMVELKIYEDIPHLLHPIVTDPKLASVALIWAVNEMENRYRTLSECGVRNIDQYNVLIRDVDAYRRAMKMAEGEPVKLPEQLQYIVIIIDEFADLMMVASKDVEDSVTRLAQKARAVGIHLILATQRPSVDVITGVIKANFPSRISYQVASRIDSRTILDAQGAERLLGNGDMLFLPPGTARIRRIHGAYVSESEINDVVDFVKKNQGAPKYLEEITKVAEEKNGADGTEYLDDAKYDDAVRVVLTTGQASASYLQRRLKLGYSRAARLIEIMEANGIVGPSQGSKPREILVRSDDYPSASGEI
jgi:S-DNA-T family DNA segregation ATPase FtsK/SpoIIIE